MGEELEIMTQAIDLLLADSPEPLAYRLMRLSRFLSRS
jgi:hypothetical protein